MNSPHRPNDDAGTLSFRRNSMRFLVMPQRNDALITRPPLLIGVLVDVSSSMAEQIGNSGQSETSRLEALRDSLDDFVERIRQYCAEVGEDPRTLLSIFAYGFGFGNFITRIRGLNVPSVQSLFTSGSDEPLLSGEELLGNWARIKAHVTELRHTMFGATPMVAAFSKAEAAFSEFRERGRFRDPPILLVISDGVPTDPENAGPELVIACADRMRDQGVVIASCFVAPRDLTLHRTLYEAPLPSWSAGARLMFECASPMGDFAEIAPELRDRGWDVPAGARLFGQINQSELLSEFVAAVVPSKGRELSEATIEGEPLRGRIQVFVSYSHLDAKYVRQRDSLLSYVRALEREGISFWHDEKMNAGDIWDAEIRRQIAEADMALVLVSQSFLDSEYCRNVEAKAFVEARRREGLRIVPVLISACDWKSVDWLRQTQIIPSGGRNIEQHMPRRGQRMAFYLDVLNELRTNAEALRRRTNASETPAPNGG
jgi:hypothetical protein